MKKRDLLFAFLIIVICLILFLISGNTEKGNFVRVSVDGKTKGYYPLSENKEEIKLGDENVLTIVNNEAYMSYADCPDKICIKRGAVSREGEEIICMPNRVIVRVEGGGENVK